MENYAEQRSLLGNEKHYSSDNDIRTEVLQSPSFANVKTYSPIVAYAFAINFIVGAGVLGLPYAFQKAGILLSSLFFIFTSTMLCITMTYIMETCARAEGLVAAAGDATPLLQPNDRFIITNRKFEINELCGMFLSVTVGRDSFWYRFADRYGHIRLGQRFYEFSLFFYTLGSMWLYATIFSSSMTISIPLPFLEPYSSYYHMHNATIDVGKVCQDITSNAHPDPYCASAYDFFLFIYGLCMVPLTCMDLSGQIVVQMSLTFFGVLCMLIMSFTALGGMFTTPQPGASSTPPYIIVGNLFNVAGFGKIFSTAIFSQLGHQGVPGLVQLVRNKKKAKNVFVSAVCTTGTLFITLSILCSLYFGDGILNVVTMHWKAYTGGASPGEPVPLWAKIVSYMVVLFPVITVSAAFPLNGITLADNLYKTVPHSFLEMFRGRRIQIALRVAIAAMPICGAGVLRNITKILEVCGLLAFCLAFWTPCLLMHYSRKRCIDKWGTKAGETPYHWIFYMSLVCWKHLTISLPMIVSIRCHLCCHL